MCGYIYCTVREYSRIYQDFSTEGGARGERIGTGNKANPCYKIHGGSSPMVTVKTERIQNCYVILVRTRNDGNGYKSSIQTRGRRSEGALLGGGGSGGLK